MFIEVHSFDKDRKSIQWHSHDANPLLCEAYSHTLTPGPPPVSGLSSVSCLEINSILSTTEKALCHHHHLYNQYHQL